MYALPSHRLSALQYSTRTFYGLLPPLNVSFESGPKDQSLAGGSVEVQVWSGGGPPGPLRVCVAASSTRGKASGMDLEGQQLLRVHVVERAQVGQFEQQLGEDGRLVGVVLGDEAPQGPDQGLLQGLHRVHVLDA